MKIYTRTGDDGTTGLFGGSRVAKDDPRVEAYGSVDELNSVLGLARAHGLPEDVDRVVERLQHDLFVLGAEVASGSNAARKLKMKLLEAEDARSIEAAIDASEEQLEPLKAFILPGGTLAAASLHMARTVARRAERRMISLARSAEVREELVVYLNRLSDLLFVLARRANRAAQVADVPWRAPGG